MQVFVKKIIESASGIEILFCILFILFIALPIFYYFSKEMIKDIFPRHFNQNKKP